jgi:hypothetical protein
VFEAPQWRENWRAICPADALTLHVPRSSAAKAAARRRLLDAPRGTAVVLSASSPGARRRCRAFATECGVEVDRQYLAFPSVTSPCYLVEDDPASVRFFVGAALVAPPDTPLFTLVDPALALVRRLSPWRVISWLAPGRMVVGWRP